MTDFENLLNGCKKRNIKLILDFVPNHSSDEHEWFKKSERGEMPYKNYYIWQDGKRDPHTNLIIPPNNWIANFRYSAWRWSPIRKQFYMHQFHWKQPDLNYRDPNLVQEMKDVLIFWMGKGVSGFRIDIIPALFEKIDENGNFPDEPLSNNPYCDKNDYCYLNHIYTMNQPETYDMAYQWRETLNKFSKVTVGKNLIFLTGINGAPKFRMKRT
jgi:alpha-glucosidase